MSNILNHESTACKHIFEGEELRFFVMTLINITSYSFLFDHSDRGKSCEDNRLYAVDSHYHDNERHTTLCSKTQAFSYLVLTFSKLRFSCKRLCSSTKYS